MKKVLLAITGIIAIVTTAILLIVCVKNDDNDSSSNLNNITIANDNDFTSNWTAKAAGEGDYESTTTFEIKNDVTVSEQTLVVASGVTLRITNADSPVIIGSSADVLGKQLILKDTTITLMEQAKLILDVNVILDGSSIISGATEGDDYFYPNLEINDSVLLLNESTIDSTNFNSTAGVVVNGTLNLDGSNANLNSGETSPITLTKKAMVIAINDAKITGKIEGNGGFVKAGNVDYNSYLGATIGKLDESFTVIGDLDKITTAGNYIVYKKLNNNYERSSVEFGFNNEVYDSGKTTRIIPFYDYLAKGNKSAQFNVDEGSTLELGGFTKNLNTYQANTNKFIIDGGANWDDEGGNVYFVTGDYDPYREGANPENDNRGMYINNGVKKEWPILYVRKNSTANLFGGVVIQNVDNTKSTGNGGGSYNYDYGTINVYGARESGEVYHPKLKVYGATIRFNHANGNENSIGGAAITAGYEKSLDLDEKDIYIADCDISYNSVWGVKSNDGAAIGLYKNTNLVMDDGLISHNHGSSANDADGGAIMVRDNSNLTMKNGTLSYNFVYGYGGAICIYSSSVTINSGNLIYNRATFGGGIASSGNPVEIHLGSSSNSDLYVAYNEAYKNTEIDDDTGYGGGVALGNSGDGDNYRQNEEIYIYGGLFEYNKALYGGGIASYTVNKKTGNKLYLEGGEIRNNNSSNGGGLYIKSNDDPIYFNAHVPLLYLSGSAKVDTSNNIQIDGNVSGQVPIEVTGELTASGIVGLISYVDTNLYKRNPNAVYFNGPERQVDKFLLDSDSHCFVESADARYIAIKESNSNKPYEVDGKTYSTLKEAVEKGIGNNETGTIYVLRNVSLTENDLVTINNGKEITIESKSNADKPYTLAISKDFDFSSQDTSNPGILRINPGCTLTLNNINLDGNSSISDGFAFIYNTGTFTLGETASLNNNISNLNGGAINIQQSGSVTNIYGTIYGNKGPNGAVYATGENITINIGAKAVFENNTALSVNTTLDQAGIATEVENVGLYLGAGVTCNFYGFAGLKDAIFYAGATLNIANKEDDPTSVPENKVNVYISNQFYTTGQIIFNVDASLKNTDFVNKFTFANGLENDSFTNGSNNTIIINKVVKAIFDFESDAEGKGKVNLNFLTKDKLNELASSLKIDQSLVTKQGHKLVIYMDVNSQLSLEIIASRASMAGHKITGFTFNESTHALTENVPFYEVSGKFIANWEENSYTFTFSHQDFNDVMGEMTAVTYNYTTGFEGGSRNIPSNKFYVVGYYFAGWKVVGTDKVLANGQKIIASDMLGMSEALNDSTNITLLAIWKSIFSDENTSEGYRNGKSEATAFIISDVDGLNRLSHTVSQSGILSFDGNDYYNTTLENGSLKYQPFSYEGYYFKLSADFDNTNAPFSKTIGTAKIKADYNPDTSDPEEGLVAYLTNTYPFSGTFDGNYSDLTSTSGISVNVNINSTGDDFLGLFGYTKDATIKNLKVTGSVTGQNSIAGVTGFMNDGSLTNVVNEANINSTGYNAGGIVGTFYRAYTNSTNDNLINLVNNGNVTYTGNKTTDLEYRDGWKENKVLNGIEGTRYGGIVGQMWSGRINGGYNSGNITARMAAGGIVGTMISMNDNSKDDSQINTALNIGNVTVTSGLLSDYQLEGTSFVQHNISAYAGGIAGRLFGASAITNVMNTANIEATYVGYTTNSSNISASSPLTHLVGEPTNMNAFYLGARGVGGIIGITSIEKEGSDFSGGNKSLEYAINTGHISGWSSVGGLVGLLAYSDVRYTINGGTIEAKGYHFINGQTEVKGGTQIYDPTSNNYKYYNYLGAIVGMAISANIDSTNYFDGDISYTGYTDAVAKATGDEVTSMGNGASIVAANKLASKELIVGTNNSKPSGLPETFFNTGWEYKTVLNTEENDYYYYPQLSALANNKILLKEVNVYKTIGELLMNGVILKAEDGEVIKPVEPLKPIIITLHLNDGYIDGKEINKEFTEGGHTYTYNDNGTLTLTISFNATTGSIVLIDSKLVKYVGFNFGGWYKDNETFEEEFSGFLPSSNIDLYAKWEAINYNITYSGFGSYSDGDVKFDGDYVSSFTIENDTITLPTNVISGNGAFTFKRWIYSSGGEQFEATSFRINKDDNNTITIFVKNLDGTDHDPITIKIANLEFTLECEPEEYNIIYYDKDGKPLTEEELKNYNPIYTYTIRDNVTLPANVDRVGHKFIGWYTDKDLLTPATNIVRGTIGHQKFYAKFEPNNYTLTIDLGRMGSLSGDSLKFTLNGTEYTLVIDNTTYKVDIPYGTSLAGLLLDGTGLKDPTPITGYSFMHYSSTYDGDEFDPTDITMSEKGLAIYAVYQTTKYEITIDLTKTLIDSKTLSLPNTINGLKDLYQYEVSGNKLILKNVEYHDNLEAALNLILGAISTENSGILTSEWNFSKWEGPDGFSIYNVMGEETYVTISPIYLKNTYTWTILDKDLQTVGTITNKDENFTTTFNINDIYQKFEDSLVPAGYTYVGFYDLSDKNQNLIIGDNLQITSNCNIVVKLEAKKLTINFYDGDEKLGFTQEVAYEAEYGTLKTHSKDGYNFKGWSLAENGSTIIQETDIVTVKNIESVDSINVYAVFDLITYVINFTNLQGYTIDSIEFNIEDDETINLKDIITNFQAYNGYTGYRFSYFTDGEGHTYDSSNYQIEVDSNLRNITLEAYFKAVKVLVIFNAGDGKDSKFNVNQDDLNDGKFLNTIDGLQEVVNADSFNTYYETIEGVSSGTTKYFITYVDFGQRPVSPQYPTKEGYIFNKWNPDIVTITEEAEREYKAAYNANTYTIYFITNNGETINPLTDIQHDQTVSETQVNFNKIKTGYHFVGWFISGTDEEFKFGDTKVTSDLTLEAKWTENSYKLSITMDYDISDAKEAIVKALEGPQLAASFDGNTLTVTVKYGTDLSSLNNIFDENGYPVGDNTYYFESYSNGTFTTMPAYDLDVTASFTETKPTKTVNIHYMGVKGEKGENISLIQPNKVSYQDNGVSYELAYRTYEIEITGYEFKGWFSDASLNNQVNSFIWNDVNDLPSDLYLKYEAIKLEITLTYINSSYEKENTTLPEVYYGDKLGEVITKEYRYNHPGYSFLGFSEVTNKQILPEDYPFTYDMALIYREEAVTYGIQFSYQKPNGTSGVSEIFNIPYGEVINYSEDYNELYYDLAWYLKNTEGSEILFNEATMPNLGDSKYAEYVHKDNNVEYIVVYAKYTPTEYTVNFDTMGGNSLAPLTITVNNNSYKLATPTKEHYEFKSYTYGDTTFDKNKVNDVTFEELISLFKENEKEITLKANYDLKEYTLKLDDNNRLTFDYEDTSVTITWDDPTKEGATFLGYALTKDQKTAEFLKTIPVSELLKYLDDGVVTIYPVFSDLNKYQVMFIYETIDGIKTNSYTVEHGSTLGDLNDLGKPDRLGYEFVGWNEDENAKTGKLTEAIKQETITKNTTYYAIFREKTYTIKFDLNGGNGTASNQSKKYTETITLPTDIKKDNYTFVGFTYNNNLYKDSVKVADLVTNNEIKEITLTAAYEEEVYQVTFDSQGGSAVTSLNVKFNHKVNEPQDPTRTGYNFIDWYTDHDLTKVYDFTKAVTGDVTLYAKWEATTYEVKLHYEENTETITFTYDALNQIKAFSDLGWNKEGYTFVGWALAQDSDEVAYQDKANTLNDLFTQNKDLYAIFTPTTYTITLDLNGGSSSTLSVQIQTGDNLLEKLANITSTKTGYTFDYWMYNGEKISVDKTFDYDNDITLKANFKANEYTLTINLDGGASEGFTGTTISVTYDSPYNNLPKDPTKDGHTFVGWYLNNTLIAEDSIVKVTDNNQTIVAKYNKNSYNVTFNTNGGSYVEGLEVTYGEKITKPDNPTNKLGYEFKYWYQNNENQEFDFNNTTMGSDPITLYAKWEVVPYTITYILDGSTYSDSYTVKSDVTFGTPTKNGYRFVNWTLEDGTALTSTKGYTGNLTVIANFEAITYHITYDLNGGTYEGANNLTYTVEAEVPFGTPTKPGYRFVNWTLEDGKVITSTKGHTADLTVKANFEVNTYHISVKDHNEINPIEVTYGEAINGLDELIVNKVGHNFTGFTYNNLVITNGMIYNYSENIEVEAQFSEIHYTIQFNANGGFGSVSSKNLSYNDEYVLPTTGYTKTGYKFIGWSKTNDGEVIKNQVSMLSSVDNSVVTLYAIYEAIEYEISFENSSEIIKIHYGDVISNLPTLKDNPSERFLGWSYNGVEIKDGMLYGYDSDIKLTANFEEKVYYIYLDALGGSLENSVIEMCYGDLIDLSKYIPEAPAGYNFIGWDLNETTMPDYNLNVKAKYEGIKYNIYFNANGANGNMTFQQATYGESTKLKANQFAKDGYVFIGWSLSSNGEILYRDESYVNVKVGGLTLYAIFEEATYKINYNLAGGKVTNNPTTYTISSDYVFNKPTKEGYKFVGFYTEDGKLVESTLGLSGNLYLTAKYEAITYNITYTSDLSIDINLLPKVYSKDNVVNFDSLTKLGYEFVGWYLNGKLVTSTLNMTGDIKLEARFKIIEYKITYVLNGANNHQDNPLKYTIKDELTFKAPTKAGYTFNGWYINGTDTKVESIIGKTGDLVLEAHFTPEKVTVTFVDGNKEIEKVEIDYNSTISQITDPTKEGYVFNSWYLDGNKYDFSKPVTKDITLEAFYNKIALSTTIDNKVITVSSTSGKGLDPNYSLSVTKIVQELPLSNAIDLLYPLGDLVTLYDIKLLDKNGNIVDLGEDVKVTITDASLKEDVTYAIVHVTDDYLDYSSFGEYKVANNTISFVTPHFSMFGVVEVFEPINLTWLWVLIVLAVTAGFAFAIVVIVKNRKYQIKFVTNGGSLIAPMRLKEDALVELPNAINPGYRFKGWYLDEKLMKEAHFGSMPKENLTLFAKWERDMDAPKSKQ